MTSLHKNKTALLPHRIMNKTSIYLAKQSKVDRVDFLGYEAIIDLPKNQYITIQSSTQIEPRHGKIFEFILAQWQATKKTQKDLKEVEIDISHIITSLALSDRTENRSMVISHLQQLTGVTIIYKWDGGQILFHLLESLRIIDSTKYIAVKVSETYARAIDEANGRYINVSDGMLLKDKYSIELIRLLQMRGAGINKYGNAKLVLKISHQDICTFMHLDFTSKSDKDKISRAFRNIHKKINTISYSYNSRTEFWEKSN